MTRKELKEHVWSSNALGALALTCGSPWNLESGRPALKRSFLPTRKQLLAAGAGRQNQQHQSITNHQLPTCQYLGTHQCKG